MAKPKTKKRKKKQNKINFLLIFIFVVILATATYFIINNRIDISIHPREKKEKVETIEIEQKISVDDIILEAIKNMGIPENLYKHKVRKDAIYIYIGLNKDEIDLNLANAIITGKIESIGGKIISGKETRTGFKQELEFIDPFDSQKYIVKLYYATEGSYKKKKPQLAIVVDDFGYFRGDLLDDFCQIKQPITLAILPDETHSKTAMLKANETNHETLIHIPMEPMSYPKNNPGKNAIYVHLSKKEIIKRMEGYIKKLPLCIGANNHMGSLVTTDEDIMKIVLEVLKRHEMFFVDSRTTSSSVAYSTAQRMMIPSFENNFFLDSPDISDKTFNMRIEQLKKLSAKGKVLIITHCSNRNKLNYLKRFIAKAEKLGFEIVPVSKLFEYSFPEIP